MRSRELASAWSERRGENSRSLSGTPSSGTVGKTARGSSEAFDRARGCARALVSGRCRGRARGACARGVGRARVCGKREGGVLAALSVSVAVRGMKVCNVVYGSLMNARSRDAIVVLIERLGGNALQELARENSQERPREVEGVVNVTTFVALVDEFSLEFVEEFEVKQIIRA